MIKDSEQGFGTRLAKATVYTVIGLTVGFILGFAASTEITHRKTQDITLGTTPIPGPKEDAGGGNKVLESVPGHTRIGAVGTEGI